MKARKINEDKFNSVFTPEEIEFFEEEGFEYEEEDTYVYSSDFGTVSVYKMHEEYMDLPIYNVVYPDWEYYDFDSGGDVEEKEASTSDWEEFQEFVLNAKMETDYNPNPEDPTL